jgi:tetratricopeptide (TPR) repeat protein
LKTRASSRRATEDQRLTFYNKPCIRKSDTEPRSCQREQLQGKDCKAKSNSFHFSSFRRKALGISEDLAAADPENAEAQFDLAVALRNISDALAVSHDFSGAIEKFRRAVDLVAGIPARETNNLTRQVQLAEGLNSFGDLLRRAGRLEEAKQETGRGLAIQRSLADSSGASLDERLAYANSLLTCTPASLRNASAALRVARQADHLNPNNVDVLDTIAAAQFALGDAAAAVPTEKAALASAKSTRPRTLSRRRANGTQPEEVQAHTGESKKTLSFFADDTSPPFRELFWARIAR